jgi:hypothetical protein
MAQLLGRSFSSISLSPYIPAPLSGTLHHRIAARHEAQGLSSVDRRLDVFRADPTGTNDCKSVLSFISLYIQKFLLSYMVLYN